MRKLTGSPSSREFVSVEEIGSRTMLSSGLGSGLTDSAQQSERLRRLRVESAWGRAVGAHLRSVTRPASCGVRRLTVDVSNPAWKRELERLKPAILSRLTTLLPSHPIDDISFRVNAGVAIFPRPARALEAARQAPRAEAPADATPADPSELAAPLRQVLDGPLRERLSRVVGRYLAIGNDAPAASLRIQTASSRPAATTR